MLITRRTLCIYESVVQGLVGSKTGGSWANAEDRGMEMYFQGDVFSRWCGQWGEGQGVGGEIAKCSGIFLLCGNPVWWSCAAVVACVMAPLQLPLVSLPVITGGGMVPQHGFNATTSLL